MVLAKDLRLRRVDRSVREPGRSEKTLHSRAHFYRRHPADLLRAVIAATLFLVFAVLARRSHPGTIDVDLFRLINQLPAVLGSPLVLIMQLGSIAAVPAAAGVALACRRFRFAFDLALAGGLAWALAKLAKELVGRGRPASLIDHVLIREVAALGQGFPSGHAAVAAALATVAGPYLSRGARRVAWVAVGVVAIARIHVGAHFPTDVLGGIVLGWFVGAALHLLLGTPAKVLTPVRLQRALRKGSLEVAQVRAMAVDARGSTPFLARLDTGAELFIKVVSREQRNADWMFKAWRFIAFREVEDEAPFATPKQQIEHEAYVALLAERADARTPSVVTTGVADKGCAYLVQEAVSGRNLDSLGEQELDEALIVEIWRQVGFLQTARIAHRDLRPANIVVDHEGLPWIVDFGFAESTATDRRLGQDVVEILVSLTCLVGPARALAGAREAVGVEGLATALPLMQPLALSAATRRELRAHRHRLEEVREAAAKLIGTGLPPLEPLARTRAGTVFTLLGAALAIHLLLPQVGELQQTIGLLRSARWAWLVVALLASVLTYVMAAVALSGAVGQTLAFGRTLAVQLASSFAGRLVPGGFGTMGTNTRYLQRAGLGGRHAVGAAAVTTAAGAFVHVLGLAISIVFFGAAGDLPEHNPLPHGWELLVAVVGVLTILGIVLWSPLGRRRVVDPAREAVRALVNVLERPGQATRLLGGSAGITAAYALTLAASLQAFGAHAPLAGVITVYLVGASVGSVSPTPGGLGAVEAALVAGLTAIGVQASPAVAGVLAFRLLTFWLPIPPAMFVFRQLRRRQVL